VVTGELLRDQDMRSMADVLRYMPGVGTAAGEGNRDTAVMRGNSSTSDFYLDGMRDDVQYYRFLQYRSGRGAIKGPNRPGLRPRRRRQPQQQQPQWTDAGEATASLGAWRNRRAASTAALRQARWPCASMPWRKTAIRSARASTCAAAPSIPSRPGACRRARRWWPAMNISATTG
jgi:hypothetical protein